MTYFLIILTLITFNISTLEAKELTEYNETNETILIWCIDSNNNTSSPLTNSKWHKFCKYKNIMLPPNYHLQMFKNLYWNNHLMIANRLSLVNFESAFNKRVISPTNDYWYVQINWWKWALWEIEWVLKWLDERWKEQSLNLCKNKYEIDINDTEKIYRCLLMRHNWRRTLYNDYTNRIVAWRNYYLHYFSQN